jgi:VanZ family protein
MASPVLPEVPVRRKVLAWAPTLLWVALIAWFSTDLFSSAHTGSVLLGIIHLVYGEISKKSFHLIHALVRKAAHFGVYAVLGGLSFYSWRTTLPDFLRWKFLWAGLALALVLLTASLDEWHQSFLPSRTSAVRDVLLDLTGAVVMQMLIAGFEKTRKSKGFTTEPPSH